MRGRFWFGVVTLAMTSALIAWGGFVTSIGAGLAVPDWPSSFNSYDPFNPWPEWWTITPILAEHGHRLLGTLVGLLTLGLGIWTWRADHRRAIRYLGLVAIVLIIVQGTLGGLRVVWVSLDMAVVHACVAQAFFALVASLVLFSSRTWVSSGTEASFGNGAPYQEPRAGVLRLLAPAVAAAIFLQIVFGALLRHPGSGIDPVLVTFHIAGAVTVAILIISTFAIVHRREAFSSVRKVSSYLLFLLIVQVALGLTAYLVILDERGVTAPSNLQVIVNSSHLVVGGFLFACSVCTALLVLRRYDRSPQTQPSLSESNVMTPA